tara:strand:- start:1429 stop:1908 length:480 start_codon:yes stop_codon:yes gene_type:complete
MDNVPSVYDNIGFEQRLVDHYIYVAKGAYDEFVRLYWDCAPGLIEEGGKEFSPFAAGFFDGMRERFNDTDYSKESYEIRFGLNDKRSVRTSAYDLYCYGYDSGEYQAESDAALLRLVAEKAAAKCMARRPWLQEGDARPARSITMSQGRGPLEVSNLCD